MQKDYDSINFIRITKTVVDLTGIKFNPQILWTNSNKQIIALTLLNINTYAFFVFLLQ